MKKSLFTTFLAVFSIILIMYLLLFIMMNSGQPLGGLIPLILLGNFEIISMVYGYLYQLQDYLR